MNPTPSPNCSTWFRILWRSKIVPPPSASSSPVAPPFSATRNPQRTPIHHHMTSTLPLVQIHHYFPSIPFQSFRIVDLRVQENLNLSVFWFSQISDLLRFKPISIGHSCWELSIDGGFDLFYDHHILVKTRWPARTFFKSFDELFFGQ